MSKYTDQTDQELLVLLSSGDKEAFGAIYMRYVSELHDFAHRKIYSRQDAEEMVHDVFESIWVRHRFLPHISSLKNYLYTAVMNKVLNYIKHVQVRRSYDEHYRLFSEVYETMPEDKRDAESIGQVMEKLITDLPGQCQTAFKLRLHEDLSNAEIAARMSIDKHTVEGYISKVFRHLRTRYDEIVKLI